jgi:hypothetical protein
MKHDQPIEYSILRDVTQEGCSMGSYNGQDISESVIDEFGRRFAYVGLAPRKWNGDYDGNALGPGEFIVPPGLVYRYLSAGPSWWEALFGTAGDRKKAA